MKHELLPEPRAELHPRQSVATLTQMRSCLFISFLTLFCHSVFAFPSSSGNSGKVVDVVGLRPAENVWVVQMWLRANLESHACERVYVTRTGPDGSYKFPDQPFSLEFNRPFPLPIQVYKRGFSEIEFWSISPPELSKLIGGGEVNPTYLRVAMGSPPDRPPDHLPLGILTGQRDANILRDPRRGSERITALLEWTAGLPCGDYLVKNPDAAPLLDEIVSEMIVLATSADIGDLRRTCGAFYASKYNVDEVPSAQITGAFRGRAFCNALQGTLAKWHTQAMSLTYLKAGGAPGAPSATVTVKNAEAATQPPYRSGSEWEKIASDAGSGQKLVAPAAFTICDQSLTQCKVQSTPYKEPVVNYDEFLQGWKSTLPTTRQCCSVAVLLSNAQLWRLVVVPQWNSSP